MGFFQRLFMKSLGVVQYTSIDPVIHQNKASETPEERSYPVVANDLFDDGFIALLLEFLMSGNMDEDCDEPDQSQQSQAGVPVGIDKDSSDGDGNGCDGFHGHNGNDHNRGQGVVAFFVGWDVANLPQERVMSDLDVPDDARHHQTAGEMKEKAVHGLGDHFMSPPSDTGH